MASESRNIRTLVGDWVRFGPGWPRDTLAKSRKGLLSVLASHYEEGLSGYTYLEETE